MKVLLIRHGESQANAERRIQGWLDSPLTDVGRGQMHALARRLQNDGWSVAALYASNLCRAAESGEIPVSYTHLTLPTIYSV